MMENRSQPPPLEIDIPRTPPPFHPENLLDPCMSCSDVSFLLIFMISFSNVKNECIEIYMRPDKIPHENKF